MGVKDLWQILAPVCERKSLWELEGKSIAIDLSGWVCDSQNVAEHSAQPNMYLRNLFFRTSCLLLLGVRPVFVLEGVAPNLKLDVMTQRNEVRGFSLKTSKVSGNRKKLRSLQKLCQEMLQYMGVHCVESAGEAEALCALLNERKLVDGCITQDSDCFLYGGRVIYRNFTISTSGGGGGPGFSVDVYKMDQVEERLGLNRMKLIGLSLLCGCDYNQGGVGGVGKETALKFIATVSEGDIFARFQSWKNDPKYELLEKERTLGICNRCGHFGKSRQHTLNGCIDCGTKKKCFENDIPDTLERRDPEEHKMLLNELNIRKKALLNPEFPSQDVLKEFACSSEAVPEHFVCEWSQPNLLQFMKFAERKLNWEESYSFQKFLPLMTRWLLLYHSSSRRKCPIFPKTIHKRRVLKGIKSYEVEWADSTDLFKTILPEDDFDLLCVTIEPQELFDGAFPDLSQDFLNREAAKKQSKKKGKVSNSNKTKAKQATSICEKCGKEKLEEKQKCMCQFFGISTNKDDSSVSCLTEAMLSGLRLESKEDKRRKRAERRYGLPSEELLEKSMGEQMKDLLDRDKIVSDVHSTRFFHKTDSKRTKSTEYSGDNVSPQKELFPPGPHLKSDSCLYVQHVKDKLSFEDLLDGEELSEADFVLNKDLNMSDIVYSITGRKEPADLCDTSQMKKNDFTGSVADCDSSEKIRGFLPSPNACSPPCKKMFACEGESSDSSDDDAPYTPLLDRIRSLRDKKVISLRRPSVLPTIQARRFSESYDAPCTESKVSLSSTSRIGSEKENLPNVTLERGKFSLGIHELLDSSISY